MKFEVILQDESAELDLEPDSQQVTIRGTTRFYDFKRQDNGRWLLRIGSKLYKIDNVSYNKQAVEFTLNGRWCEVDVRNEQDLLLDKLGFKTAAGAGEGQLNAPMPGKILEIMAGKGDKVEAGRPVVILEAMKMENELKAPVDGIVSSVAVQEGDSVEKNALLMEIKASG